MVPGGSTLTTLGPTGDHPPGSAADTRPAMAYSTARPSARRRPRVLVPTHGGPSIDAIATTSGVRPYRWNRQPPSAQDTKRYPELSPARRMLCSCLRQLVEVVDGRAHGAVAAE